jgi:type IV pilus assembly protein PilQ
MPEPITQRYPMMQMESVNNSDGGNAANGSLPVAILLDEADFFSCTEVEVSTLTDEIPNVDVSFIEADIHDALLELSLLTGLSIITDDSIEGIVSINFVDKSVDEVISAVIAPGNYGFRKFDSFIYVGSQSPVSPSFHLLSDTCTYKPVYMQAFEMVKLLTPYYQQYVNYHETLGHISIVAPSSIQARIQKDLRIFDQAPQQILLEMSIVEVSEEALDMLGVKWRREALGGDASAYQENIFRYYDPLAAVYPVAQSLIDSVSALDTDEEVDIRAMPSMVTLNGREANFSSTQTAWLPMQSYSSSSTDNEVNYGVNLRIIPYISRGKQVRLEILQASVSDLTKDLDDLPKLVSHAISTSVIMVDGETLVLGGLMQKKNRSQMSKVPGASNSSLFGGLFKHAEGAMVTTEVLIVIRPKILKS